MKTDTRIAIGFALVYLFNGIFNMSGTGVFSPMVFIDWFLLAVFSLLMAVWPPFNWRHLIFLVIAFLFLGEGSLAIGYIRNETFTMVNMIVFVTICLMLYSIPVIYVKDYKKLVILPLVLFICTIICSILDMNGKFILIIGLLLGVIQVLLLAIPAVLSQIPLLTKRFYLIMTLSVFYDHLLNLYYEMVK